MSSSRGGGLLLIQLPAEQIVVDTATRPSGGAVVPLGATCAAHHTCRRAGGRPRLPPAPPRLARTAPISAPPPAAVERQGEWHRTCPHPHSSLGPNRLLPPLH